MKFGVGTFVTDDGIGPAELGAGLEQRGIESLFLAEHTHIRSTMRVPTRWVARFRRSTTGHWIRSWR